MLSFLVALNKKSYKLPVTIILSTAAIIAWSWNYDVQNFFPTTTLTILDRWLIRISITSLLISVALLSMLSLTVYFYKKDMDSKEAESAEFGHLKLQLSTVSEEVKSLGIKIKSMPKFIESDTPPPNPEIGTIWIDTSGLKK